MMKGGTSIWLGEMAGLCSTQARILYKTPLIRIAAIPIRNSRSICRLHPGPLYFIYQAQGHLSASEYRNNKA